MDKTNKGIILDLCGGTGSWSRPWEAAGFDVRVLTLPEYDVREIKVVSILGVPCLWLENKCKNGVERLEALPISAIVGIFAAPPCTEFSVLNCKAEARTRDEVAGMEIVAACMYVIEK